MHLLSSLLDDLITHLGVSCFFLQYMLSWIKKFTEMLKIMVILFSAKRAKHNSALNIASFEMHF